jgi:hypothetical protein
MDFFERHTDTLGTGGSRSSPRSAASALRRSSLSMAAIGAGFLINDLILLPLLVVSLSVALWGLEKGREVHGATSGRCGSAP